LDIITPTNWEISDSIIEVIGVGGGGCNAVNYMFNQGITGCSFAVCNTDSQVLRNSPVPIKVQMGAGLGAGTNPVKGRNAALEAQDEIDAKLLKGGTQMVFITAGMGGGTGTGAAPVIAKMAKEKGILTVAVVTIPFENEGNKAKTRAIEGIKELEKNVDSLIIINNDKLYEFFGDQLVFNAFPKADEVLATAVRGVIEIIKKPGYINVDFEDVKTMMKDSGMALMGYGEGSGHSRIDDAVKMAFCSPLLNALDLKSASNVLINITCGHNDEALTMDDLKEITRKISEYTGGTNNFKHGLIWEEDPSIGDQIRITSIVTGLRLTDVLEYARDIGDYIMISEDFVLEDNGNDVSLPEDTSSSHIGYSSQENSPCIHYDLDNPPVMICHSGENFTALNDVPAIRRTKSNK